MRRARSQTPPPRCVSRGPIFSLDAFLTRRFRAAGCHHGDPARPLGRVLPDPQRHRHAIRAIPDRPEFASRSDPTLAPARRSDGRIRDRFRLHDRALSPSPEPAGLHTEGRGPPRAVEEVRREAGRGGHLAGGNGQRVARATPRRGLSSIRGDAVTQVHAVSRGGRARRQARRAPPSTPPSPRRRPRDALGRTTASSSTGHSCSLAGSGPIHLAKLQCKTPAPKTGSKTFRACAHNDQARHRTGARQ